MEFKNHKIAEALCAFRFEKREGDFDIPMFGEFSKKIHPLGFTLKKEIKPFKVSFQISTEKINVPKMEEEGLSMVFTNPEKKLSIVMKENYISFHAINNSYPGWEDFYPNFIEPYLKLYFELDVSKNVKSAQMLYLNNFEINLNEKLSEYLTCVPDIQEFGECSELSHLSQNNYKINPNLEVYLKTILNIDNQNSIKKVILECNCVALNTEKQYDWIKLINDAHTKAKEIFFKVTQKKLKDGIK